MSDSDERLDWASLGIAAAMPFLAAAPSSHLAKGLDLPDIQQATYQLLDRTRDAAEAHADGLRMRDEAVGEEVPRPEYGDHSDPPSPGPRLYEVVEDGDVGPDADPAPRL